MKKTLGKPSILLILMLFALPAHAEEQATQYKLIMSKDDTTCSKILKLYNDDLKQHGQIILENHDEFNWVKWENINFVSYFREEATPSEFMKNRPHQVTQFDINNDGVDETVIRSLYDFYVDTVLFQQPTEIMFLNKTGDESLSYDARWGKFKFKFQGSLSIRDELVELEELAVEKINHNDDRSLNFSNGPFYFRKIFRDAFFYPMQINTTYYVARFGFYTDDITQANIPDKHLLKNSNLNLIYQFEKKISNPSGANFQVPQLICFLLKTNSEEI